MGRNSIRTSIVRPVTTKGDFFLFVLSVYSIMGKEALVVLATLSRVTDAKMDEPIIHVTGWVNSHIVIAAARSYYRLLHGVLYPSLLNTREPELEFGSGLGLEH